MKKLYVASITPFDGDGKIQDSAMCSLFERNLSEGADGFFVGGSSGECFLLSKEERIHSFQVASQYADRCDLFAHVGAIGTREAIDYAKEAKQMGIQNIAATPPFYFGFSEKEIAGYYYDIAEAVGKPVLYYNIPSSTHRDINLSHPDIRALFQSGAVGAIKHTNLNLYQMERLHDLNPEMKCYGGFENCMVAFLAFGCDGFIGSNFNFMLPQYRRVMELYLEHREEEARVLQAKSNTILDLVLQNGLCASLKYILTCQGLEAGKVRKPLMGLTKEQETAIDRVLEEYLVVR